MEYSHVEKRYIDESPKHTEEYEVNEDPSRCLNEPAEQNEDPEIAPQASSVPVSPEKTSEPLRKAPEKEKKLPLALRRLLPHNNAGRKED